MREPLPVSGAWRPGDPPGRRRPDLELGRRFVLLHRLEHFRQDRRGRDLQSAGRGGAAQWPSARDPVGAPVERGIKS